MGYMYKVVDVENNRLMDFDDIMSVLRAENIDMPPKAVAAAFELKDSTGDGVLSIADFEVIL